ncbi:hypothetical protein CHARACLAT_031076 [Characodon lateralis]|uniref:Secreted protein n=1 Tax=Characodon lateralis TaxID=208331 RepID=A0ABU7D2S0_9TELE|nr:hypothetical protein [Characodon lateralis]
MILRTAAWILKRMRIFGIRLTRNGVVGSVFCLILVLQILHQRASCTRLPRLLGWVCHLLAGAAHQVQSASFYWQHKGAGTQSLFACVLTITGNVKSPSEHYTELFCEPT